MYGNGWPGSTASGVRTGKISSKNRWRSASWCSGIADVLDELDAFGRQLATDIDVDRGMIGDELEDPGAGGGELFLGGPAVGRPRDAAGLELLAQAGDPDLEELVEIAREDRQELDPLQERIPRVARLVEDPRIELEP